MRTIHLKTLRRNDANTALIASPACGLASVLCDDLDSSSAPHEVTCGECLRLLKTVKRETVR